MAVIHTSSDHPLALISYILKHVHVGTLQLILYTIEMIFIKGIDPCQHWTTCNCLYIVLHPGVKKQNNVLHQNDYKYNEVIRTCMTYTDQGWFLLFADFCMTILLVH